MSVINDSNAKFEPDRQFAQLKAIVTIVRDRIGEPSRTVFRWLDLGCGQGQVLAQLIDATTPDARSKIEFHAVDAKKEYLDHIQTVGAVQGLRGVVTYQGFIEHLDSLLARDARFDLITCVSVFHELGPLEWIPKLLVTALSHLADHGLFSAYDMESLEARELELGAVNWSLLEIRELLSVLSREIGFHGVIGAYRWRHTKTDAWNFELDRRQLGIITEKLDQDRGGIEGALSAEIRQLIERKHEICRLKLESLTIGRMATKAESESKVRALYEYWALSRTRDRLGR